MKKEKLNFVYIVEFMIDPQTPGGFITEADSIEGAIFRFRLSDIAEIDTQNIEITNVVYLGKNV